MHVGQQIPPGSPFTKGGRGSLLAALLVVLLTGQSLAEVSRIVSLAPSVTEILFALGVGDRVVGVSTHCDYPRAVAGIDRIGTFLSPNVERILTKEPDLVIGVPSPGNRTPVETLERLGLRVMIVDPDGVAEILATIRAVAEAVGVPEAGERLIREIGQEMERVTSRVAEAPARRVLMLVGRKPFIAVGPGTYQAELIELAGGTNVAKQTGTSWPNLSLEFIIIEAPEVLIDASMGSEEDPNREAVGSFWHAFPTIPAVRDGRIHGYRAYELLRPGPRIPQTLEALARFIHPEQFAGQDSAQRAADDSP